jgi:hypothetical protein
MRTDELLEACLQALSTGQEIPPDITRYLARHPEQRAEIEELIFIAQRASNLPQVEISSRRRTRMQQSLAARMGVDPALLDPRTRASAQQDPGADMPVYPEPRRWRLLAAGRSSLARLRDNTPAHSDLDDVAAVRIRTAFRNLTPEDIRRYIGDRGEDYLYYRQRFPQWELVFGFLAFVLRGFKRLEKLTNLY